MGDVMSTWWHFMHMLAAALLLITHRCEVNALTQLRVHNRILQQKSAGEGACQPGWEAPILPWMPYEPSLARALVAHERAVRRGPDPV